VNSVTPSRRWCLSLPRSNTPILAAVQLGAFQSHVVDCVQFSRTDEVLGPPDVYVAAYATVCAEYHPEWSLTTNTRLPPLYW
jgi:hypothetical protein